jgi:Tfp pilus assembly protein PilF
MTTGRLCLVVAAVAVLVHGPTLPFDFTYFDDDKLVLEEQAFLRDPANVPRAFQRDVFGTGTPAYRPLLTVSFMLDAAFGGKWPLAYHATNVAIHAVAAVLVLLALRSLGYGMAGRGWAAIVFAVHPLLVQAVAWIPGRNDSLLGLWALAAWVAFVAYLRAGAWWAGLGHALLFLAALLTKETALVLPVVCVLYVALIARAPPAWRRTTLLGVGWLAAIVTWWALRAFALTGSRSGTMSGAALAANARAVLELLGALVVPLDVRVYPLFSVWATMLGVVVAGLVVVTAVAVRPERRPHVLFGALWFVVFLLPTLAVREPTVDFDYLDHRIYLPCLGVLVVALEAVAAMRLPLRGRAGAGVMAAVAVVLAGLTVWHSRHFTDAVTFWTRAVHDAPGSSDARYNLGYVHYARGNLNAAEESTRAAIALRPSDRRLSPKYHLGLGLVHEARGQLREAADKYEDAIALDPAFALAHTNRGTIDYREGRLDAAEAKYRLAMTLAPRLVLAHVNMCALRYQQQRLTEAEAFCRQALRIQGDSERALLGLASVHYSQGRYAEAIREVDDARARGIAVDRLFPGLVEALRAHRRTPLRRGDEAGR